MCLIDVTDHMHILPRTRMGLPICVWDGFGIALTRMGIFADPYMYGSPIHYEAMCKSFCCINAAG